MIYIVAPFEGNMQIHFLQGVVLGFAVFTAKEIENSK